MSHLTAQDLRSMAQLIDACIAFLQFTGQRDPALIMLLQGIRFFFPYLVNIEVTDLDQCTKQCFDRGEITPAEYKRVQYLLAPRR
jgi:hypothetical protein